MPLKLKREQLERIVYEELTSYIARQLNEAPPGRGTVLDDDPDEIPDPENAPEEALPTSSPAPEVGDPPPDQPAGEEPADDDLEADLAGEESGAEPGTVAAELENKTIESISLEEDSKIMPGATEVVLTFQQTPDALRLLITKTGKVKIFFRGLHNDFGSPIEQIPGEEEDELGAEEPPEGEEELPPEETEEMPPLGPNDMPPEDEPEEDREA
jgi:hypothetical protein